MAIVTKTATVMTCVRNGYTTTPSEYAVGGPGTQPSYNNSIYMTFPNLGIPQGSTIHSATLSYTMTGWDWHAAINIDVQACSYAGTPSSQAPVTGSANTTSVPAGTYVHSYSATNAVIQMISSGAYYLKMFAPNGSNRKMFSSTKATLTVDYTSEPSLNPPSSVTAPGTITSDSHSFVWGSGSDNNGVYSSSQLSYDMQIYSDSAWSSNFSTGVDIKQYTLDLRTHFGKQSGQYYYDSNIKIRVCSKVFHNGGWFYSGWKESTTGIIDWRIVPNVPSALTLSDNERYEGEAMTFTVGRPGSYNDYDSNGSINNLTYTVELDNGTDLVSGGALVTAGSKILSYTVGELTSNKSDLNAKIRALCKDTQNQVSPTTPTQNLKIKRFRQPVIVVTDIDRVEMSATVNISIIDTGFGSAQSSGQIGSVEYKLDDGAWTGPTLGTWDGLNNSFEISGLDGDTRYNLSVRCTNFAADTSLSAKASMEYSASVFEFTPAFFVFKDSVTGAKGIACKSLIVGDDYSQEINEGEIRVNGNEVWNSGNDGSGSGLDADKLDGYHATVDGDNNGDTIVVRDSNGDIKLDKILYFENGDKIRYDDSANIFYADVNGGTANGKFDNADKLDGYHASVSSEVNTVAVRDSNGYLQARIFQDVDSWDIGTVMPYYINCTNTSSSDRYHRRIQGTSLAYVFATRHMRRGTCTLNDSTWVSVNFSSALPGTPQVTLTANTTNSGSIVGKVRNVTSSGFDAVIGGAGAASTFNYIAVWY